MAFLFRKSNAASSSPAPTRSANVAAPKRLVGDSVCMEDHGNTVFCCAFSPGPVDSSANGSVDLATASYDGTTRIWDLQKCVSNGAKKCRRTLKMNPGGVWCCAYTLDSAFLITGCSKGSICLYSTRNRYDLVGRQDLSHGPNAVFACTTGSVKGVNLFATGGGDNNLRLWSVADHHKMGIGKQFDFAGHSGDVVSCCFRPNTSFLVSGSEDRHIRVWDVESQDCTQTLIGHTAEVCSCTYDRHGSYLASGSSDKTVRLWDARQKNRSFQTLHGHKASVYSVAFRKASFDLLATASQDGTVMVWDPRSWKCAQVLEEHNGEVVGLAWHPHGTLLATGSADMTVNLHSLRSTPPEPHEFVTNLPSESEEVQPSSNGSNGTPLKERTMSMPSVMEVSSETLALKSGDGEGGRGGGRAHLERKAFAQKSNLHGETTGMVDGTLRKTLEDALSEQQLVMQQVVATKLAHPDSDVPGRVADPADVEDLRRKLEEFYGAVNPSKMVNIAAIVSDYAARGGGAAERRALNDDLRTVYGCDLESSHMDVMKLQQTFSGNEERPVPAQPRGSSGEHSAAPTVHSAPPTVDAAPAPPPVFTAPVATKGAEEGVASVSAPPHRDPVDDIFAQMMAENGVVPNETPSDPQPVRPSVPLTDTLDSEVEGVGIAGLALVDDEEEYDDVDPFAGDDIPGIDGLQD
eukprot:Tamp_05611.p1 GENE.Tamp_05611~~Tamp_05611.p1  ORF type:complete len:742 (+),score=79.21 Tamp_05611:158-2227(+)